MSHSKSSTEYLELYRTELDIIDQRAHKLLAELNEDRFNWKPAPETWSVGQCIAHLAKFNGVYLDALAQSLDDASRQELADDGRPFKHALFERFFLWTNEPPPKFKVKAPTIVQVGDETHALEATKAKYFETHKELRAVLDRAHGVHLKRAQVRSPLSKVVKVSLAAAIGIVLVHERRHLWQAEQLL